MGFFLKKCVISPSYTKIAARPIILHNYFIDVLNSPIPCYLLQKIYIYGALICPDNRSKKRSFLAICSSIWMDLQLLLRIHMGIILMQIQPLYRLLLLRYAYMQLSVDGPTATLTHSYGHYMAAIDPLRAYRHAQHSKLII